VHRPPSRLIGGSSPQPDEFQNLTVSYNLPRPKIHLRQNFHEDLLSFPEIRAELWENDPSHNVRILKNTLLDLDPDAV